MQFIGNNCDLKLPLVAKGPKHVKYVDLNALLHTLSYSHLSVPMTKWQVIQGQPPNSLYFMQVKLKPLLINGPSTLRAATT